MAWGFSTTRGNTFGVVPEATYTTLGPKFLQMSKIEPFLDLNPPNDRADHVGYDSDTPSF